MRYLQIALLILSMIVMNHCVKAPTGPTISLGGWDDSPNIGMGSYSNYTYLNIEGTVAFDSSYSVMDTKIYLYDNSTYNDTVATVADSLGNFAFEPYACSWEYENRIYRKEVFIKAENTSGSTLRYSEPKPVECKSDTQRIDLELNLVE